MAKKGSTTVLKTQNVGFVHKTEKTKTFVIRPNPGKHTLKSVVSLGYVLRDLLHLADNIKEVKYIINNKEIIVDKKPAKTHRLPIGFYDVIEIPKMNKQYRAIILENGLLSLTEIEKEETKYKICKIVKKKLTKKGEVQLTTNDGRSIITTNQAYKTKASVKLDLEDNTIKEYYPLEKGRKVYVIGGKHKGTKGTIENVTKGQMNKADLIKIKIGDHEYETTEKNVFVIN